jgi:16S rRNA (cytosine967-C5)-methyltransferase
VADALRPQDDSLNGLFDRVLLDAPCSGLGTIRRKPEIRWRMKEEDLPGMARLQKDLLRSAAVFVRPGGFLVYSVCSVMPEENEAVVQGFLSSRREFSCIGLPDMIRGDFPEGGRFFKAMPHRHGMDGFFAAVLKRS